MQLSQHQSKFLRVAILNTPSALAAVSAKTAIVVRNLPSDAVGKSTRIFRALLLRFLVLLLLTLGLMMRVNTAVHFAEASGFLRWSRSFDGSISAAAFSSADIVAVVSSMMGGDDAHDQLHTVSVVNATTGLLLLNATIDADRIPIVIRPEGTAQGATTCTRQQLSSSAASEGNSPFAFSTPEQTQAAKKHFTDFSDAFANSANDTTVSWCAVFLASPDTDAAPLLLLPSGEVKTMLPAGVSAPWKCGGGKNNNIHHTGGAAASRCMIRTPEQQPESIGGCYRRRQQTSDDGLLPSHDKSTSTSMLSSHVVLVDEVGNVFSFRPLDVALGIRPIRQVTDLPVSLWRSPTLGWAPSVQFLALPFVVTSQHEPTDDTTTTKSKRETRTQQQQAALCALAFVGTDGAVALFDADRDDDATASGLPLLAFVVNSSFAVPKLTNSLQNVCYPFVQTVRRLVPATTSTTTPANSLYETVLSVNCRDGRGWLLNAVVVVNATKAARNSAKVHANSDASLVRLTFEPLGTYQTPPEFDKAIAAMPPTDPLATDLQVTLVQPSLQFDLRPLFPRSETSGKFAQYVTTIAALRYVPLADSPESGDESTEPAVAIMSFVSNVVNVSNSFAASFTETQIGAACVREIDLPISSAAVPTTNATTAPPTFRQNVTQTVGWVAMDAVPAYLAVAANVVNVTNNNSAVVDDVVQIHALKSVSLWFVKYGVAFSVLMETAHALLNSTTGLPIGPSDLVLNTRVARERRFHKDSDSSSSSASAAGSESTERSIDDDGDQLLDFLGGVKHAAAVRLAANSSANKKKATALPPILSWSDSETVTHSRATFVTPLQPSSYSDPTCVYTLAANSLGVTFNIAVRLVLRETTSLQLPTFTWVADLSNLALFNPFTQSVCTQPSNPDGGLRLMVPAGPNLIFTEKTVPSVGPMKNVSRITINPLYEVVARTAQVSYSSLTDNHGDTSTIPEPRAAQVLGSPLIYVCVQQRLFAYYGVIGNTSWAFDISSAPQCALCVCKSQGDPQNNGIAVSRDRTQLVLTVVNQSDAHSGQVTPREAILVINNTNGVLITFVSTQTIGARCAECVSAAMNAAEPRVGQLQQVPPQVVASNKFTLLVMAPIIGTRCFLLISLRSQIGKSSGGATAYVFFFVGIDPQLSSQMQMVEDVFYFETVPGDPSWAGRSVYGVDVSRCVKTIVSEPDSVIVGIVPISVVNNVISYVGLGASLFVLTVDCGDGECGDGNVTLRISSYVPRFQGSIVMWGLGLDSFREDERSTAMQNASVFIVSEKCVCAATGPLYCMNALAYEGPHPYVSDPGAVARHFGVPAIDPSGTMVFASPHSTPHALRITPSLNLTWIWAHLSWQGSAASEGVEMMNVDLTTCDEPQMSHQALVIVCGADRWRRLLYVEAATGLLLLVSGQVTPMANVFISDAGVQMTYVNCELATIVTVQLVAEHQVAPMHLTGNVCGAEINTMYSMQFFPEGGVSAQATPGDADAGQRSATYAKPLLVSQWAGYRGLRLGRTFVVDDIAMREALVFTLPPSLFFGEMYIVLGETLSMTGPDFVSTLMSPTMCEGCALGCPVGCAIDIRNGDQFRYTFSNAERTTHFKPFGEDAFRLNGSSIAVTYSGSARLSLRRYLSSVSETQQQVPCNDFSSELAKETNRFCMNQIRLGDERWATVHLAAGRYASTSTFAASWKSQKAFTKVSEMGQLYPPFVVSGETAIINLVTDAMNMGMFPDELIVSGATISSAVVDSQLEALILTSSAGNTLTLGARQCQGMMLEIPYCPEQLDLYAPEMRDESLRSVTWIGLPESNWGSGFIATGFEAPLASVLRAAQRGLPQSCGVDGCGARVQCQPTTACASQTISYLNQMLFVACFFPLQSSLAAPLVQEAACANMTAPLRSDPRKGENEQDVFVRSQHLHRVLSAVETPGDLVVQFQCRRDGTIAMIADSNIIVTVIHPNVAMELLGATFACTECTYFLLKGVIAQPFSWLAVGALKNLIVCILFYWMTESVKNSQREQSENRKRLNRLEKQIRAVRQRLDALQLSSISAGSGAVDREKSSSVLLRHTDDEDFVTGDRLLPRTFHTDVSKLSREERDQERFELQRELECLHDAIDKIRDDGKDSLTKSSKWRRCVHAALPSPITLYAHVVTAMGRFRHSEDRRLQVSRIKDNIVFKELTTDSLVNMLMSIVGESPEKRQEVVSFAHFYQWNLCDNRQWVIREHVDEQSQFASPKVLAGQETELHSLHQRLQGVYTAYKIAFRDVHAVIDTTKPFECAFDYDACSGSVISGHGEKGLRNRFTTQSVSAAANSKAASTNEEGGHQSHQLSIVRQRSRRLRQIEDAFRAKANNEFIAAVLHQKDGVTDDTLFAPSDRRRRSLAVDERAIASNASLSADVVNSLTHHVRFSGLDGGGRQSTRSSLNFPTAERQLQSRTAAGGEREPFANDAQYPMYVDDREVDRDEESSTATRTNKDDRNASSSRLSQSGGEKDGLRSVVGAEFTRAFALKELSRLVDDFNSLHETKPHCFEYASLPSRKLDDKLLPSPILIILSLLQTVVVLIVFSVDIIARTQRGQDGSIKSFDFYQCVFFMLFNSSLPSSLIVNAIARADLGKTTHTRNSLEKVRDILTDPYVVLTTLTLAVPMCTHVIPGFFAYAWLLAPPLVLSCLLEYYLRTRVTVHSDIVVIARLVVRVLVLFVASVVLSLSYNFATAFLWAGGGGGDYRYGENSNDGRSGSGRLNGHTYATGSFVKEAYWDVVVSDYNSRSFACAWDHVVYAISNFLQMGFFF